ncbi:MAG: DUF3150 domain-containing protein [Rhodospirillaceae bacterium]|nr:DUF3150 domain-containing protein [Rhodospirillaceae bacterium]
MRVLEKTVCVMLSCTVWTGCRRMRPEDLGTVAAKLPPGELASMGSLKLCDPAELQELAAIRRRAQHACERLAVKFLGGYATDEANLDRIVGTLNEFKAQFDAAASRVVGGLQGMIDQWADAHPEWEEAIRRCPPDVSRIASQLRFDFQVFRIAAPADGDAPANDGLERAVSGLSRQLYREIAVQARSALRSSFEGKSSVGQRAVRVITVIAEKLDALSYLDGGIRPVLDKVRGVRDTLPKTGRITGRELVDVMGLLSLLGNEGQLAQLATVQAAANGASDESGDTNGAGAVQPRPQEDAGAAPLYF